ncbi:MAG: hypothetical protein HY744_01955 [Deltaproteobacteria bacterium]|nr:hypothetical protein [Deltaproteobacteria bacterium]
MAVLMHLARAARGSPLLAAALLAGGVAGCELLVTFDRSLIADAGPGSGGATGGADGRGGADGHGGAAGHGGAGGGPACATLAKDTECRAKASDCDVSEKGDGQSADCPADGVAKNDVVCRAVAGDCDLEEKCDGQNKACPQDAVKAVNVACRVAAGDCDLEEKCDGQAKSCPTDALAAKGAPCAQGMCDGAGVCKAGLHLWSKPFGDAAGQAGFGVVSAADGAVLLAGYFMGAVDFGGGSLTSAGLWDMFVTKLDKDGKHLWSKRFGDASYDYGYGITAAADGGVLLSGSFQGTVDFGGGPLTSADAGIFVARFDSDGTHLWSKRFGTGVGRAIASSANGTVLLTGYFTGSADFGGGTLTSAGSYDIFVAKFDKDGNHLWSKRIGDPSDQHGYAIAVDASGAVLLTGAFKGSADFGGGPLTSAGDWDIFVAKLGP